jgi:hypothetical protein
MTGRASMKSLRSLWIFIFFMYVTLVGLLPVSAGAEEVKWVFMGFTKYRDALYIEMNSVYYPSHTIAGVWSLIAPSNKSKYLREVKRELQTANKSADGFWCSEILTEIECTTNRIRHLQVVYFNKEAQPIHSATASDGEWKAISSGSLWDTVRNNICKN